MQKHMPKLGVILMAAMMVAGIGVWVPLAFAAKKVKPVAPIPQTGQTTCWKIADGPIDCTDTGQDGDIQAGVPWPSPRLADNLDGTVTDHLTALIWFKNADCFSSRAWTQSLTDANTLTSGRCGLTDGSDAGDWQLPNLKELLSLIDYGQFDPALPAGHPFLNVATLETTGETGHWSSTTRMSDALLFDVANPFVVRL